MEKKILLTDVEKDAIKTMMKIVNDSLIDHQDILKILCPKEKGILNSKSDEYTDMVIDFIHRHFDPVEDQEYCVDDTMVNYICTCDEFVIDIIENHFVRKEN